MSSRRPASLRRRFGERIERMLETAADRAAARARVPQTESVWHRYQLRKGSGEHVPLLTALNELYVRQERIENKLDLLLGHRPVRTVPTSPVLRRATLPMPTPPPGWAARSETPPAEIALEAHWSMYVGQVLSEKGISQYEPSTVPHLLAALELAPPGAMYDVGTNVGPYGLLARAYSDRQVVGFEPTPELAEVAQRIGELNGLDYAVERIALGDHEGTVQLYLSDSTDSSNSLNPAFRPYSNILDVPLVRLDDYVETSGLVPGLVKVDTETTEPAVLRGAVGTVAEHRPWVFCEVLSGQTEQELAEVVEPWGYTWYHLTAGDELKPAERIVGDPTFTHFMYLLVPEPLGEDYWSRVREWTAALEATPLPGPVEQVEG